MSIEIVVALIGLLGVAIGSFGTNVTNYYQSKRDQERYFLTQKESIFTSLLNLLGQQGLEAYPESELRELMRAFSNAQLLAGKELSERIMNALRATATSDWKTYYYGMEFKEGYADLRKRMRADLGLKD